MFKHRLRILTQLERHPLWALLLLQCMAWWLLVLGKGMLKWDNTAMWLPWKFFITESLKTGSLPLWNPYTNFGFPQMGDPGTWYPISYLFASMSPYGLYQLHAEFIFHGWLAGAGMYVLNRSLGHGKQGAFIAALAYQWSGFFIGNAQHLGWLVSAAWLPWVIWCFRAVRFHQFGAAVPLLAVLLYFQLSGGYPGMFIISTYLLVLLGVYYSIGFAYNQEWASFWKWLLRLFIAAILFLCCSAVVLSSTLEFSQHLVRGNGLEYHNSDWGILNGSFPLKGLITLIYPFAASLNDNKFWGEDFSMINLYLGVIPFFVAFWQGIKPGTALAHRLLWLLGVFALGIAMAHVFPFRKWLYDWVPGMDQFRFPSIFRSVFLFAFSILAGAGFEKVLTLPGVRWKWVLAVVGTLLTVSGALYVLIFCLGNQSWNWSTSTIPDRIFFQCIIHGAALLLLAVIGWWYPMHWKAALLLVVIGDLWTSVQLNQRSTALSTVSGRATQSALAQLTGAPPFPILNLPMRLIQEANMSGAIPELYANQGTLLRVPGSDGSCPYILKNTVEAQTKGHWDHMMQQPLVFAPGDAQFKVRTIGATASSFRFEVEKTVPGQIVFAQHQYPGWKARLNGHPLAIQTYLTAWMCVDIPVGKHQLEFVFEPDQWFPYAWVSFVTLLLLLAGLTWQLSRRLMTRKQKTFLMIGVLLWLTAVIAHWISIQQSEKQKNEISEKLNGNALLNLAQSTMMAQNRWAPARILPEIPQLVRSIDSGQEKLLFQWGQPNYLLFEDLMNAYFPFQNLTDLGKGKMQVWSLDSLNEMDRMAFVLAAENMENLHSPWLSQITRDSSAAYAGKFSQPVPPAGYSAGFKIPCVKMHGPLKNATVLYGAKVKGVIDDGTQCVIEVKRGGQTVHWFGQAIRAIFLAPDEKGWWHGLLKIKLPDDVQQNDELVAYVWNNSKEKVWVDHCSLTQFNPKK